MKPTEPNESGDSDTSLDTSDALQVCLHFTHGLPTELAVDLAVVAGVLMAHPQSRVAEDALARLGQAAHAMFHLLDDEAGLCPDCGDEVDQSMRITAKNEDENKGNKRSPK